MHAGHWCVVSYGHPPPRVRDCCSQVVDMCQLRYPSRCVRESLGIEGEKSQTRLLIEIDQGVRHSHKKWSSVSATPVVPFAASVRATSMRSERIVCMYKKLDCHLPHGDDAHSRHGHDAQHAEEVWPEQFPQNHVGLAQTTSASVQRAESHACERGRGNLLALDYRMAKTNKLHGESLTIGRSLLHEPCPNYGRMIRR